MFYLRTVQHGTQHNYLLGDSYSTHIRGNSNFDFSKYSDDVQIVIVCASGEFAIGNSITAAYVMTSAGGTFARIR